MVNSLRAPLLITYVWLHLRSSDVCWALQPQQQVFILKTVVKLSEASSVSRTHLSAGLLWLCLSPLLTPRTCFCICCSSSCFKSAAQSTGAGVRTHVRCFRKYRKQQRCGTSCTKKAFSTGVSHKSFDFDYGPQKAIL